MDPIKPSASSTSERDFRHLPSVTTLLKSPEIQGWLKDYPRPLILRSLREALQHQRIRLGRETGTAAPGAAEILTVVWSRLQEATEPNLRGCINATGIILHTGLGRAVAPSAVIDSLTNDLKGYVTLAVDRESGERIERDTLVEPILRELTGAEAAVVAGNNAAATLLVLTALTAGKEVIVSRGQLIEIGGSFRLPDVMEQSGARLVEVGATNRTHLKDYRAAINENTAAILQVHPSNYRIVGFTKEVPPADLSALAREHNLLFIDDLGAGALVDLELFGLPHERTVQESIKDGADVALFSADKLIGAAQGGIVVGRKPLIQQIAKHPLMRAVRVDKSCLMILERTLQLFRDPERLRRDHPIYEMLSAPVAVLKRRAQRLARGIRRALPSATAQAEPTTTFLGSGSLPAEPIPSFRVTVTVPGLSASELARRLRLDPACVFTRIEEDRVCLDVRAVRDHEVMRIVEAISRVAP